MANEKRKPIPNALTLNEHLGVTTQELASAGVLNTIIGTDTKLFIDPKLLRDTAIPEFEGAMEDIDNYFGELLAVNAQAKFPMAREKAISMIAIKEPRGLSIGYGNKRDSGTSISRPVAIKALRTITELVRIGIEDEKVMEMLGLFIKKFASDSISDLTAYITYPRLCAYTARKAKELGVLTVPFTVQGETYDVPKHPQKQEPIILLPLELLSDLPLATSWDEIAEAARKNQETRKQFNKLVGSSITKYEKRIKANPGLLISSKDAMDLLITIYDEALVKPYDRVRDGKGYMRLADFAAGLRSEKPREYVRLLSGTEMLEFVRSEIIERYRHNIEDIGQNEILYNQTSKGKVLYDQPLHENVAQTLFHAVANHACSYSNMLSTREPRMGKAAVDFHIATHPANKVLIELKKSDNKSLLDGYNNQLERYIQVEKAAAAVYLVVIVDRRNQTVRSSQLNQLRMLYAEKVNKKEKCPELIIINGLEKIAPSKLKGQP